MKEKLGKIGGGSCEDKVEEGMKFEFIGHLQSNKAKLAVGKFNRIQSIDSSKILHLVGRLAKETLYKKFYR